MSSPSHLILDYNFKSTHSYIPYWVLSFSSASHTNLTFLNEINTKNINSREASSYQWLNFLKHNKVNTPAISTFTTHLTQNSPTQGKTSSYIPENLININFLRYERLYTKLKYSRSPAFDIVSGGAAALLAGFVGFLISEKFGFELVDSGDFYYLFMYGVFGAFLLKPLMYTLNVSESFLSTLSYRNILKFFTKILLLFFKTLKSWVRV